MYDMEIQAWLQQPPHDLTVDGNATSITIEGEAAGDITIAGTLDTLTINGPSTSDITLGGSAGTLSIANNYGGTLVVPTYIDAVEIGNTLVDTGNNYVDITDFGSFECSGMMLSGPPGEWLAFGTTSDPNLVLNGTVDVVGTLSGVIHVRSTFRGSITVDSIDGALQQHVDVPYGGVYFERGTRISPAHSHVLYVDEFEKGCVVASTSHVLEGSVLVVELGTAQPKDIARIWAVALSNTPPVPCEWYVGIGWIGANSDGSPSLLMDTSLANRFDTLTIDEGAKVSILGNVDAGAVIQASEVKGTIDIGGEVNGLVAVKDLRQTGRVVAQEVNEGIIQFASILGTVEGIVEVLGDLHGRIWPQHQALMNGGQIHVHGSVFADPNEPNQPRIWLTSWNSGAIVIDYDGYDPNDAWQSGATVNVAGNIYTGNSPAAHVYEVTDCRGDMDNDGDCDTDDVADFYNALGDPNQFVADNPGLDGCAPWHGDVNQDSTFDIHDEGAMLVFSNMGCCAPADPNAYANCRADFDASGTVDLGDLQLLLTAYGSSRSDPNTPYDPRADLNDDDFVNLSDLQLLLSFYGRTCSCGSKRDGGGGGEKGLDGLGCDLAWTAFDTEEYEGDGFAGESQHFVFDLTLEMPDEGDDWTTTGVALVAEDDAAFRLSRQPTIQSPYATFVTAPCTLGDEQRQRLATELGGAFAPAAAEYTFGTNAINMVWYDKVDSFDGPGVVMRLVLDVGRVEDADVSEGFGSVYFSASGPRSERDICLGTCTAATGIRPAAGDLATLNGAFYVTGK